MPAIIEAQNLGKCYRIAHKSDINSSKLAGTGRDKVEEFWALKELTFNIQAGDRVGLIGRNGAGKSTLLKVLSRVTPPTTGNLTVRGRMASLLEVTSGFHPDLTGRENIFLNGAILGMSKADIRSKFDDIVAFSEVEKFLDTPVKRFSSGMYARLAFAVASHLDSEIMIIDEVLSVGDGMFQKKCLDKINSLADEGRTILFVSHSIGSITSFCTTGFVLSHGRLIYSGDAQSAVQFHLDMGRKAIEIGDLSHYRRDGDAAYITAASSIDSKGQPVSIFALGSDITFSLSFNATNNPALNDPVMGLTIYHSSHGIVGSVNSRMTGYHAKQGSCKSGTMQCTLSNLPLIQGRYSVDISLGDGQVNVDTLLSYLTFEIADMDVYNTSKAPLSDDGIIYFDPNWQFKLE